MVFGWACDNALANGPLGSNPLFGWHEREFAPILQSQNRLPVWVFVDGLRLPIGTIPKTESSAQ
jgi:hypothetical protein